MQLCPQCGTPNEEDSQFCMHCGASTEGVRPDPLVGRTVGGAYLLQELIGVGGMGRVYRAEQAMLGRTVAVKVIHPHLLGDDQTVARFYNEARAASRLNHPASVSIIDFGRTEDGILYLVMEHLDGRDMAHIIADEGPLPFIRICRVLRHVLSALGEAHALGVVHRDLKPENIISRKVRRGAEQIKVVDFGLAHIVGPGGTSITTPGLVCGTPDYMSPEQGRGETVDGRGDLYSCGVVLFEMLTDRLPYEDDTPTKVVFKHIHDPVPDPREVAPHRAIPDDLAEICLKSLRKKASERFQSADEMYEVLQRVEDRLEAARSSNLVTCAHCATKNPATQKFCGGCGARLSEKLALPPGLKSRPPSERTSLVPMMTASPLVGREAEIERLVELRDESERQALWVSVLGDAGVGKSRLLSEVIDRMTNDGDVVAVAGPHPSGAPVPYWPIRLLLRSLLEVDDERLADIATSAAIGDPIARAGIGEVLEPVGLPGLQFGSRAEAVAVALAAAVRVAAGRSDTGRVALVVDDLWRADSLSADVLRRLVERMSEGPLFLATASQTHRGSGVPEDAVKMLIRGLERPEAAALLTGAEAAPSAGVDRDKETVPEGRLLLPLYIEQLRVLGAESLEGDDTLPPRLADAVLARVERLNITARRLLQVIVTLGDSAPLKWIKELARDGDLDALGGLIADGLVTSEANHVHVAHPFIRELVEASIPAELRKELHAASLQQAASQDAPLEVRAEHAWRAGEPMSALLLLERMGDQAIRRGDAAAAVLAFRRGLELARRELHMTGDTTLDRAIVTFSRKLGDATDRSGDSTTADGVLREALELAGPANPERQRMLMVLSRVAIQRKRPRDATRFLGQALELATKQKDVRGEAQAHVALGKLRLDDGDARTAANTLENAAKLALAIKDDRLLIDALLARARALRAVDDGEGADKLVAIAREAADRVGSKVIVAETIAAAAPGLEPSEAAERYREAGRLASEAGDAEGARRWFRLGRVSEARQAG